MFGLPSSKTITKFVWKRFSDWDYQQADDLDAAKWDAPDAAEAIEAAGVLETDPVQAFERLLTLAERGSILSMDHVAHCYYSGKYGVVRDVARAEYWYRRGYEAGSRRALLNYGRALAMRKEYDLRKAAY